MIKVLYVDDEPSLLDLCREFVEVSGQIEMDTALSVHEAEREMARTDYGVVISGYRLPDANGIDLLKRIRSRPGHIPFILLASHDQPGVTDEAMDCGADLCLQKEGDPSIQFGRLRNAIRQMAGNHVTERPIALFHRKDIDPMDEINAIAIRLDREMRVTYVNPYGLRQLGWGEALVGTSFLEWLDRARSGKDEHPRHIFQIMFAKHGEAQTLAHSFRTREGEKRWVQWTCSLVRNEQETVEEIQLFGTDVTDAKRNEAKLQRSLSLIKAAFDSSEEGIMVTGMDRKVTESNQRFLDMWGLAEGALDAGIGSSLMARIADQVRAPDQFISSIHELYEHPLDEKRWTVDLLDGRIFEASAKPVMLGTEVVGRFWSFMDYTVQSLMEREFRIREKNIIGLLDNNKANMLIIEPKNGDIVYANRAAIDFYGYGRDRFMAMRITDINTLDPSMVAEKLRSAHAEKRQYFIFQHRMASGEVRDVEVFSGPIEFEGRSLLFSIVHDISDMERTKRLVEESELRHNRVLNSLAVGILVSDASNRIIYANKTVQELLRMKSEELVGLSPIDLIADEHKELARSNYAARVKGERGKADYRFVRGDGTVIWVQITAEPLFEGGVFGGTIASIVDISERRRDAEIIEESERKFRDIFNNMQDAVMIHEPDGPFFEVNDLACERFGYSREEMCGMRPEDLDVLGSVKDIPEKKRRVVEKGCAVFESSHMTKDGRIVPSEISAKLIDYQGRPAILVVCRDITERKIADMRLERATEKLKILNSITRHDILNQLLVLQGNLTLARSSDEGSAIAERLERIGMSANVINSQLQFAKDYQEMGTALPLWQNVAHIIQQLPDVREIAELETDGRLERLQVYADPMLGKVFHNIMEDTVKYARRPLIVRIGFEMKGNSMVLVYEDQGPGIMRGEKERIFEMGFGKGTGLGLHLSREILSITDIEIKETGEPGKGVRFEITVPEGRFRFNQD